MKSQQCSQQLIQMLMFYIYCDKNFLKVVFQSEFVMFVQQLFRIQHFFQKEVFPNSFKFFQVHLAINCNDFQVISQLAGNVLVGGKVHVLLNFIYWLDNYQTIELSVFFFSTFFISPNIIFLLLMFSDGLPRKGQQFLKHLMYYKRKRIKLAFQKLAFLFLKAF